MFKSHVLYIEVHDFSPCRLQNKDEFQILQKGYDHKLCKTKWLQCLGLQGVINAIFFS